MSQPVSVIIYTDGACRGNPGVGGWGALLCCGDRQRELLGAERETTSNRMELSAVIGALSALKAPSTIKLFSDSQYVVKGASEWLAAWKTNGWRNSAKEPVKNQDLWERIDVLSIPHKIEWQWVKGYNGDVLNERVDALTNRAIDELLAVDAAPGTGDVSAPAGVAPAPVAAAARGETSAGDAVFKALLAECLPILSMGLPPSLFIDNAPESLVARMATALAHK